MHDKAPKVTPESAKMHYEASVAAKAKEYGPVIMQAFPTESAMRIALSNSMMFLETAEAALGADAVTAQYFCEHGPLAKYPDELFTMMALFVDTGVFYPAEEGVEVFHPDNADKWRFKGSAVAGEA